jgi:hypothetical protein
MNKSIETTSTEFGKFDATMSKILSVSRRELQVREKKYKRARLKKKRAKIWPASHAFGVVVLSQFGCLLDSVVLPVRRSQVRRLPRI